MITTVNIFPTEERDWVYNGLMESLRDNTPGDIKVSLSQGYDHKCDVNHAFCINALKNRDIPAKTITTCHHLSKIYGGRTQTDYTDICEQAEYVTVINKDMLRLPKSVYAPFGVDLTKFKPTELPDKPTLGIVGANRPVKNSLLRQDILINIRHKVGNIRLSFVGVGWDEDVTACRELGYDTLHYPRDRFDYSHYPELYDEMTGILVTSYEEGACMPMHEAVAKGRYVISTDVGHAEDLNVHLYKTKAQALDFITQMAAGTLCKDKYNEPFDLHGSIENYYGIYRNVAGVK